MLQLGSMIHAVQSLMAKLGHVSVIRGQLALLSLPQPQQHQQAAHLASSSAAARLEPANNPRTLKQGAYPSITHVVQRIQQADQLLGVYNALLKYRTDVMPASVVATALSRTVQLRAQQQQQQPLGQQVQMQLQPDALSQQHLEDEHVVQQPIERRQVHVQGDVQEVQHQQPVGKAKRRDLVQSLLLKAEWQLSMLLHVYDGPQLASCAVALCKLPEGGQVNRSLLERCLNILLDHNAQLLRAADRTAALELADALHYVQHKDAAHWSALAHVLLTIRAQLSPAEDAARQAAAYAFQWAAQQAQIDNTVLQVVKMYSD